MAAPVLVDSELSTSSSLFLGGSLLAGDLAVIVVVGWNGTVGSNVPTLTIFHGLSWTKRERAGVNSNKDVYVCIAYASVVSDTPAMSINLVLTNSTNHACLLYRVPGGAYVKHNSATGDTWSGNPTTFTTTLGSAPSAANGVLLAFGVTEAFDGQCTIAPVSGWTELNGNEDGTLGDLSYMTAWREGSTDAACSVEFNNDEYVEAMVAMEISAVTDTNITPSTIAVATELPTPTIQATPDVEASTVAVAVEVPAATATEDTTASPDTVEIVAEIPQPAIPVSDITPITVEVAAEVPTPAIDVLVPTVDVSPNVVTISAEVPFPTLALPDEEFTPTTVLVQVEVPTPTLGGDATTGPPPKWRIGGYPSPSIIARATGERSLASR